MPEVLKSLQRADLSFCDEASSFLQSGFWGKFKSRFGWEPIAFKVTWQNLSYNNDIYSDGVCGAGICEENETAPLLVLRRSLGPGLSLAYVPWGPELPAGNISHWAALKELAVSLKKLLPKNTVFIRFDPPWQIIPDSASSSSIPPPFIRAGADIQAPDTVLIDLSCSMESIMEQMKPKWRYNARLALKKGVVIHKTGAEGVGVFYNLLGETARRDGIAIHSMEYYRSLFEEAQSSPHSPLPTLYLAGHDGDVIAGIITVFRGQEAFYLYGASSDKKRSFMAPYALQVKAMEDAKDAGCTEYDLFGIPPCDDPDHPMAGLYRFKTGFGGRIVHRPGSWDYPCRPFIYHLFRSAETFRKNLRTLKKNRKKSRP